MSSPPDIRPDNLVSLVLHSKKALQTGEQLCSRANDLSNASAQSAVDVLALDAKVRWITDGVLEQLKVHASIYRELLIELTWVSVGCQHREKHRGEAGTFGQGGSGVYNRIFFAFNSLQFSYLGMGWCEGETF
jgi:hypothetical protein